MKIESPIRLSVLLDGYIYDNKSIADNAVNRVLILRSCKMKFKQNEPPWDAHLSNVLDRISLYGIDWIENLLIEYKKTQNSIYLSSINYYVELFLEWFENNHEVMNLEIESFYNRTYVFYRLLKELELGWVHRRNIYNFLIDYHYNYFINIFSSDSISANIKIAYSMLILSDISADTEKDVNLKKGSLKKISSCLENYFDFDMLSIDNSIANHAYYIDLLNRYSKLLKILNVPCEGIKKRIIIGLNSMQLLTTNCHTYPMLGNTKEVKSVYDTKIGNHLFKDSGICLYKEKNIYLILKNNQKKIINKHADDLSIILYYKGRNIFCDSGMDNNIDNKDKVFAESIRGHSGITRKDYFYLDNKDYQKKIKYVEKILSMNDEGNETFNLNGILKTNQNEQISRNIILNENLSIIDSWENEKDDIVTRFNLHPDSNSISISNETITFYNNGLFVKIIVISDEKFNIEIDKSIYINEMGKVIASNAINIFLKSKGNGKVRFDVKFNENELENYNRHKKELLDLKYEKQIERALNTVLFEDIYKYCNFGVTELYRFGRKAYLSRNLKLVKKVEILIKILHGCSIKCSCEIGLGTKIAYGGIGVLIHFSSIIGRYCNIGTNVSLASSPTLGDYVYVSTGARLIKPNLKVGSFSIVGANAVVIDDVEPFSIVGGTPAKLLKKITPDNLDKYLKSYLASVDKENEKFVLKVRAEFIEKYNLISNDEKD